MKNGVGVDQARLRRRGMAILDQLEAIGRWAVRNPIIVLIFWLVLTLLK
jgi:hypothetical protein